MIDFNFYYLLYIAKSLSVRVAIGLISNRQSSKHAKMPKYPEPNPGFRLRPPDAPQTVTEASAACASRSPGAAPSRGSPPGAFGASEKSRPRTRARGSKSQQKWQASGGRSCNVGPVARPLGVRPRRARHAARGRASPVSCWGARPLASPAASTATTFSTKRDLQVRISVDDSIATENADYTQKCQSLVLVTLTADECAEHRFSNLGSWRVQLARRRCRPTRPRRAVQT